MTYGKEPFDLRLTMLCMCRRLPVILAVTLLGTLLFGGGYYVKNVVLRDQRLYTATSIYQVAYAAEEKDVSVVYINEMSWNTYIRSQMFLDAVRFHLAESMGVKAETTEKVESAGNQEGRAESAGDKAGNGEGRVDGPGDGTESGEAERERAGDQAGSTVEKAENAGESCSEIPGNEELAEMLQAFLASDLRVPSTVVTTDSPEKSIWIAQAVEAAMTQEFAREIRVIVSISVIDSGNTAKEVVPDVRVGRAFVLSAVLSCFFAIVAVLLQITGEDGIRLPSTIWKRYGVRTAGTMESKELRENLRYFFRSQCIENKCIAEKGFEKGNSDGENFGRRDSGEVATTDGELLKRVAVCAVQEQVDAAEALKSLQRVCPEIMAAQGESGNEAERADGWFAVPAPLQYPESSGKLRKAEGILLVVRAGAHGGRQFEHVLEYLQQQDCKVTAAILWDADEKLIRWYYAFERTNQRKGGCNAGTGVGISDE